jgi:hypothetical protein
VAVLVLAFAALLVQRTRPAQPISGPQATATAAHSTASPVLATSTTGPAGVPLPRAAASPTATPFPTVLTVEREGGHNIGVAQNEACASGMVTFVFSVIVDVPTTIASFNFAWQHYDGATPLGDRNKPYDGQVIQAPDQVAAYTIPAPGTIPVRVSMWDSWRLPPDDSTGSQARWGDQFLITAVNGRALTTPIASHVLYYATGC